MAQYPESVDIIVSFERDKEGKLKSCKVYDGNGTRLGYTETLLQDTLTPTDDGDLFGAAQDKTSSGAFKVQLYVKDTVKYIKSKVK